MGLNNRTKEVFEVTVDKPKLEILRTIDEGKNNYAWTDSIFGGTIDYKEIKVNEGRIEIRRGPTSVAAFRSLGTITVDIVEMDNGKSQLICEVHPYNNLGIVLTLFAGALTLWTIGTLLISKNLDIWIMIAMAWGGFGLTFFLQYKYYKWALIQYTRKVINELSAKKASR